MLDAGPRMVTFPDYPFRSHFLDLGGIRLHYIDEGSGDPVVMVHGNPTWSYHFRHLIRDLAAHYRVIAPDHVGCGLSDKPSDTDYAYTLSRRVDDFGRFIDYAAPRQRVTLVLHDWGGLIGLAWACQQPQRIRAFILGNTAAFPLPAGKPLPWELRLARLPILGAVLVRGLNAFCRGAVSRCTAQRRLSPAERAAYLAPYDSWARRRAIHRFLQDIPLRPGDKAWNLLQATAAQLPSLNSIPALILWGKQDFVFDEQFLSEWQRFWPQAQVHLFANAGHFVFEDVRREAADIIRSFLEHRVPRHGTE